MSYKKSYSLLSAPGPTSVVLSAPLPDLEALTDGALLDLFLLCAVVLPRGAFNLASRRVSGFLSANL